MRVRACNILVLLSTVGIILIILLVENIRETEGIYAYAIKGYVQDIRHNPRLLIGGWALKKAIKLKKLKLLLKLKKKLKLKFIAKKILLKFLIGKRKRSADDDEIDIPEQALPHIEDNDIMPYFSMATEFDTDGCLPKSICEAVARSTNRTSQMNMFERTVSEDLLLERPEETSSPSFIYEYAAYYGKTMKNEKACASLFSNCHEPPPRLQKFMDETFRADICDGPDQLIPQQIETSWRPSVTEFSTSGRGKNHHSKSGSGDITFPLY